MGVLGGLPVLVVAGTDADPFAAAVGEMFFFPDGGGVFEGVDRVLTGRKCFGAMGHTNGHKYADFSND